MTGAEGPGRPIRLRPEFVAAVVLMVLTLTAALVWQPWARTGQGPGANPSPGPGGSSGSPAPSASPGEAWAPVDLEPIAAVATLEPSRPDDAGVQPDATFTLTSLTSATAITLARRVEVTPATALAIRTTSDTTQVMLAPEPALTPGATYRFALRAEDGSLVTSWAFRVRSPLHVLGTLPGDRTTEVPVTTGIEVTFDQEGAADIADYFSISPAVKGRFERHGRTQVFVPDSLAARTLYTVTIKAGLPRSGTDLKLETDVVARFETGGESETAPWVAFGRDVVETSPTEAPVFGVQAFDLPVDANGEPVPMSDVDVKVYRLPSQEGASKILADFLVAPRWTAHTQPLMPTEGLPVVATFSAPIEQIADADSGAFRFPEPLPKGWYIVEAQGARLSHAFLQVTPVSAWVSVLTDRTVVWVNDVATTRPIEGATVAILGGAAVGTTDQNGLMIAATPDALVPPAEARQRIVPDTPPLLSVRSPSGDTVLIPFQVGWDGEIYRGEWWEKSESADATYWSILETDRTLYRADDTIQVWGYLRGRDDDAVPAPVTLRLTAVESANLVEPPAISRATATPERSGSFSASLSLDAAPLGSYQVQAVVEGRVVASCWLQVDVIRKPAYRLTMTTDHQAVITGTAVRWTTTATFFDGSPVPELPVTFDDGIETGTVKATDATGVATVEQAAPAPDEDLADARPWSISTSPAVPEEGDISTSAQVVVFPSSYHLEASGVVKAGRLQVTGALHAVDLAKVEAAIAADTWDWDPNGKPVAGRTIQVRVTELVSVRRLVGSSYDFIEKQVVPRYEYDTKRVALKSLTVRTGTNGQLAVDLAVPDPKHEYEVALSTKDPAARIARRTITAGQPVESWWSGAGVRFQMADGTEGGSRRYGIGDLVSWRMTDDGVPFKATASDRYLYIVAQRGLRSAAVTGSPTFERTFGAADAPGVFIMGVRFTGSTYAPKAASWADFKQAERQIDVTVTTDRQRYRPGEDVTFTVRTTDAQGKPVAASVVLQAVDEKLYAMGGANTPQPLDTLYRRVDSGIVRLTATHQVPTASGPEGEGGDTTGGGPRDDFRDTLAFRALQTDATGHATTTVRLSDDLTSWHVAASAVTAGLQAGVGELLVPVALPLFVDATIANEYLLADHPTIRLRAYGEALQAGDPVEFTVSSSSLGLAPTKVAGKAFDEIPFELPAMSLGRQTLDIAVIASTRRDAAGKPLADRLIRTFSVVRSRLTAAHSEYAVVGDDLPAVGGTEAATYTFSDAGRGRYLPILLDLSDPGSARLDRVLAETIARDLLVRTFDRDPASLPPSAFDPRRYPIEISEDEFGVVRVGIALLPYGGTDPRLLARVAMVAPDRVSRSELRDALLRLRDLDTTQRDLWIATVAGLASLGESEMSDLQATRALPDLTVTERLYLALGFTGVGDDASALVIERKLLAEHGQQLGPWVRLQVGTLDETAEATALLALLAAGVGDPLAPKMIDYVLAHPSRETTHALEVAGATERALERTPAAAASFAYTVDGRRTDVTIRPGETTSLSLTAQQRASLRLERLSGEVGVAVDWREPVDASSLGADPALDLTRTIPADPIPSDRLVRVSLKATFSPSALESGCYEVVEEVPSGLAPTAGRLGDEEPSSDPSIIWPSSIVGQRVTFCVPNPMAQGRTAELRYWARVVDAGTYAWEPAVMQLEGVSGSIAVTRSETVRIGGG
jgi:hypothetical protein